MRAECRSAFSVRQISLRFGTCAKVPRLAHESYLADGLCLEARGVVRDAKCSVMASRGVQSSQSTYVFWPGPTRPSQEGGHVLSLLALLLASHSYVVIVAVIAALAHLMPNAHAAKFCPPRPAPHTLSPAALQACLSTALRQLSKRAPANVLLQTCSCKRAPVNEPPLLFFGKKPQMHVQKRGKKASSLQIDAVSLASTL